MKPRRNSAILTDEDTDIWYDLRCYRGRRESECAPLIRKRLEGDRRDADRMLRIMRLGCRFCGSNSMHGEVHERDCIYVTDPSRRQVWNRKGARIIE